MAKAKSIMIQGTMSNAGKSLLAAGLCRIFAQDGYKVAPFKSQNMALNSFITEEGLEMGRAQVMQAEAAGIAPMAAMNPILLKPTTDMGSQVIVNGQVQGNMTAMEYYKNKQKYIPAILHAYHRLEDEYDIIVLEGAGSPAEINLKQDDIVNMGMAKMAKAPVLLAGDIDRGGVFAQLLGTLALLTDEEKRYVKGLIVNKFRGDKNILMPGIDMLEEMGKVPVAGIVPYLNVDIDDEDSLSERFSKRETIGLVDIAVIRLPKISNFTDFNPFEGVEEVSLRYVSRPADLKEPDIIILPGSKSTIEDMMWLRETGMEAKIKRHASQGKIVIGVCGGYQMLGEAIHDPEGIEHQGSTAGMGLLPVETTFQPEKTRTRVQGMFHNVGGRLQGLTGVTFEGYEIHMGSTTRKQGIPLSYVSQMGDEGEKKSDGAFKGNVYGTYIHGIFDEPKVVQEIISSILKEKGIDAAKNLVLDRKAYKEKQYDILAEGVRQNMDMEFVYKIIEEGM